MPEVLRPLYESSAVLAQKTTMAVRCSFINYIPVSILGRFINLTAQ